MTTEDIIFILLRSLSLSSGIVLMYAGLFIYPDERNKLQNRLEDIWLGIGIGHEYMTDLLIKSVMGSCLKVQDLFNKLFGVKLVSKRSILASMILSAWISPVLTFSVPIAILAIKDGPLNLIIVPVLVIIGWTTWILSKIKSPLFIQICEKRPLKFFLYTSIFFFSGPAVIGPVLAFSELGVSLKSSAPLIVISSLIIMAVAIVSDFFSIYITRRALKAIVATKSILKMSFIFIVDFILAAVCSLSPFLFVIFAELIDRHATPIESTFVRTMIRTITLNTMSMNITNMLPTIFYFALALILIIHLLVWSSILRPLYNIIDTRILEKRKLLVGTGLSMISGAIFPTTAIGISKKVWLLLF